MREGDTHVTGDVLGVMECVERRGAGVVPEEFIR
jgi:hypothetical protein